MKRLLLAGTAFLALAALGSNAGDTLPIAVSDAGSDDILGGGRVFGLNALCSISIARTAVQQMRRKLASISALRRARNFAFTLQDELRRRPITQSRYAEIYTTRTDPWNYEVTAFEFEKFQGAIELLDVARNDACFTRAWEIGCAEGALTAQLAQICERLSAVDFIPLALERARVRCQQFSNISFSKWDLKSDPVLGPFDLIVIMDVLGSFGGRRAIRRARDKVVSALAPGGYLLYGDCLGELHRRRIQDSWWGRLLLRGPRNIHRFVATHPALVEVGRRETTNHLLALFRNRR
jgi:protein-L-isoaspartate O-methyltransferase